MVAVVRTSNANWIPLSNEPPKFNRIGKVSGWNSYANVANCLYSGGNSSVLEMTYIKIVNPRDEICQDLSNNEFTIDDYMVCAIINVKPNTHQVSK